MVKICENYLLTHSMDPRAKGAPKKWHLKHRNLKPRDIVALTLKYPGPAVWIEEFFRGYATA